MLENVEDLCFQRIFLVQFYLFSAFGFVSRQNSSILLGKVGLRDSLAAEVADTDERVEEYCFYRKRDARNGQVDGGYHGLPRGRSTRTEGLLGTSKTPRSNDKRKLEIPRGDATRSRFLRPLFTVSTERDTDPGNSNTA